MKLIALGAVVLVALGVVGYFFFIRHPASSIELLGLRYGQSCTDFADAVFDRYEKYYEVFGNIRGRSMAEWKAYKTKSALAEACEKGDIKGEVGGDTGSIGVASPNGTMLKLRIVSDDNNKITGWQFYIQVGTSVSTVTGATSSSAVVAGAKIEGSTDEVMTKVTAEANDLRRTVMAGLGAPLVQLPCGSATTKVWRFRKHLLMSHDCGGGVLELFSAKSFVEERLSSEEMRTTLRKALRDDGLDL